MRTFRQKKIEAALRKILERRPPEERATFLEQAMQAHGTMESIMRAVVALEDAYSAVDLSVLPDKQAVMRHIDDALDALVTNAGLDPELGKLSVLKLVNKIRGDGLLREVLTDIQGA